MGIGPGHVPDLIRMACDPELNHADQDDPRVYAPLHAWRALGQLPAPEAAAPLAELLVRLPDDDFAHEELPEVLGRIGAAAVWGRDGAPGESHARGAEPNQRRQGFEGNRRTASGTARPLRGDADGPAETLRGAA